MLRNIFSRILRLIAVAAIATAAMTPSSISLAQDMECKFEGSGYSVAIAKLPDDTFRGYRIFSSMERKILVPNHYHSTAAITWCDCPDGAEVSGALWLTDAKRVERPDAATLQTGFRGSTSLMARRTYERGIISGGVIAVTVGGLPGWLLKANALQKDGTHSHDVIELAATDGCIGLMMSIETSPSTGTEPIPEVIHLLSTIRIETVDESSEARMEARLTTWAPSPPDRHCEGPVTRLKPELFQLWMGIRAVESLQNP